MRTIERCRCRRGHDEETTDRRAKRAGVGSAKCSPITLFVHCIPCHVQSRRELPKDSLGSIDHSSRIVHLCSRALSRCFCGRCLSPSKIGAAVLWPPIHLTIEGFVMEFITLDFWRYSLPDAYLLVLVRHRRYFFLDELAGFATRERHVSVHA